MYHRRIHEEDLAGHSNFLFRKSTVVGTFFQRTFSQWYIKQNIIFSGRMFQTCIFTVIQKKLKTIKGN